MDLKIIEIINSKSELKELFKSASKTVLNQFIYEKLPPHKTLIKKGTSLKYIYIICSGRLRINNEFPNGRLYEFGTVQDIGFSGLLEFFAGKQIASSTVETLSETVILTIPRDRFSLWIEEDNKAFRLIVGFFANQLYPTTNSIGIVFSHTGIFSLMQYIEQRVATKLEKERRVILPDTRQEMADSLGLSLRTIYRLVAELKENGFIDIEKRRISVNTKQYLKLKNFMEELE